MDLYSHLFYFKAKRQNKETLKTKGKVIVFLVHGLCQNIGSQYLLAKQFKEKGLMPYHLGLNHGVADFDVILNAMIREISFVNEKSKPLFSVVSGHSNGGNVSLLLAEDSRVKHLNIVYIQLRAIATKGFKSDNIGRFFVKLCFGFSRFKKLFASFHSTGKAFVTTKVFMGSNDSIAKLDFQIDYPVKLIEGKNTDHFATAGIRKDNNRIFVSDVYKEISPFLKSQ